MREEQYCSTAVSPRMLWWNGKCGTMQLFKGLLHCRLGMTFASPAVAWIKSIAATGAEERNC